MSCHTGWIVSEWFAEHKEELEMLPWPSNSPHINPIEHPWFLLKQVQSIMASPQNTFRGLIAFMFSQVRAVFGSIWMQHHTREVVICFSLFGVSHISVFVGF